MSKENKMFNPRLIITDHFDAIINKIDIKTETLLENQSLTEELRNDLNELREKQIEKIKEIEQINLNNLTLTKEEEEYEKKWSNILSDVSLEYSQKIDKIKEMDLIHFDCVLVEHPENKLDGFSLWITSWFYNQNNLEFLK